jgi:hypothetical protein
MRSVLLAATLASSKSRRTRQAAMMNDTEPTVDEALATARSRPLAAVRERWIPISIVAFFIAISLLGVTNSSIGVEALSSGPSTTDGVVLGAPRTIRSDEWLRSSPWRAGTTIRSSEHFRTPLAEDPSLATATPNDGLAEYIVFLDATAVGLLRPVLPDTMLFALYWWLPLIIVLLAMPKWLQILGVRSEVSWLATILVVLSPSVAWWSIWPMHPLAWSLLASLMLMRAVDLVRRRHLFDLRTLLLAIVSGLLLARTAFSYFPWAFPIGVAVLAPTLAFLVRRDRIGARMLVIGAAVGVGILAMGAVVLENWAAASALAGTVYPGARVGTGSALNPGIVFGAQHLGLLKDNPPIATLNQSEISTAYSILIVPSVILLVALPGRAWKYARTWATAGALVAVLLVFLTWISTDVPNTIGHHLPGLNRVPPMRLSQIVGIPVVFVFALALDRFQRFKDKDQSQTASIIAAGTLTLLASAWAGSMLRSGELPSLRVGSIWFASIFLAVGVVAVMRNSVPILSSLPLVMGAVAVVLLTNPVMVGFGGLRSGEAVDLVVFHSRDHDGSSRWTSDHFGSDAILMANAIPSLSGQQWIGPSEDAWLVLDPQKGYNEVWNRAASFVAIVPAPGINEPEIVLLQQDVILVRIDPCDAALSTFRVDHMISSQPVSSPCLTNVGEYSLGDVRQFVYERSTDR